MGDALLLERPVHCTAARDDQSQAGCQATVGLEQQLDGRPVDGRDLAELEHHRPAPRSAWVRQSRNG